MIRCTQLRVIVALSVGMTALPSFAGAKDKKQPKPDPAAESLFDALGETPSGKKGGLNDLKQAAEGIEGEKAAVGEQLKPREEAKKTDGKLVFKRVLVAQRMVTREGRCVPEPQRITYLESEFFPFQTPRLSVCAVMADGPQRAMRMSVTITTGRGKEIARAESIADFTGKALLEHAIDFPSLKIPEAGVYRYVVDIEGERVANLPLFEVRTQVQPEPE